jgi:hypothetical protein
VRPRWIDGSDSVPGTASGLDRGLSTSSYRSCFGTPKKPRRSGAEVCDEWWHVPAGTRESRRSFLGRGRRDGDLDLRLPRPAHRSRRPRLPSRCARVSAPIAFSFGTDSGMAAGAGAVHDARRLGRRLFEAVLSLHRQRAVGHHHRGADGLVTEAPGKATVIEPSVRRHRGTGGGYRSAGHRHRRSRRRQPTRRRPFVTEAPGMLARAASSCALVRRRAFAWRSAGT